MATVTLQGNPMKLEGELPVVGSIAPDFTLVSTDLSELKLSDFAGKRLVLNIFPSLDTSVCAMSVRKFNQEAASYPDTVVLCVSMDLPLPRHASAPPITSPTLRLAPPSAAISAYVTA